MTLPPFVYSLKFWQSLAIIVAVVATQFGWVSLEDSGKILVAILALLNLFEVVPELRAKGLIK